MIATEDLELLHALPARALAAGYVDVLRVYPGLPMRDEVLRDELPALDPSLQPLVALFALGDAVRADALAPVLGEPLLAALERLSVVLRDAAGRLHTAGLRLLPFEGHVVFVPAPRGAPVAVFGEDTIALAARLQPRPGARCVVLHAGSGALALAVARVASQVIAVEDQPVARACAELNVVMAGLDDKIALRDAAPAGERFDHVAANPPLLPFPRGLFEPEPRGDASPAEELVRALPELLGDGGVAQVVGADLGDAAGPRLARAFGGLGGALTVTRQEPLPGRLLGALAHNAARAGVIDAGEAARRMQAHLARTGCDRLYLFSLVATRGAGVAISRPDALGGGYWTR